MITSPLNAGSPDFRSKFAIGIAQALFEAGHCPDATTSVVDVHGAAEELLSALALVLHASPDYATPSASRKQCDLLARIIQKRISEVQRAASLGALGFIQTVQPREVN